jgi:hypothetical protein
MPSVPKGKPKVYTGPDRRRQTQRSGKEQRGLIRWEPKIKNRRRGKGRRQTDLSWNND